MLNEGAHALGRGHGAVFAARHEDHEFIAAVAKANVIGANRLLDELANLAQNISGGGVTVQFIDKAGGLRAAPCRYNRVSGICSTKAA